MLNAPRYARGFVPALALRAEARVLQVVDPNLSRQSVDYLLKSARVKVVVIRAD